jgi:DNA-3-methyladenine glycosylase
MIFGMPSALFAPMPSDRFGDPRSSATSTWRRGGRAPRVAAVGPAAPRPAAGRRRRSCRVALGTRDRAFALRARVLARAAAARLAGFGDQISAILRSVMLYRITPNEMLGRVSGSSSCRSRPRRRSATSRPGARERDEPHVRDRVGRHPLRVGCGALALVFPALVRYDARSPLLRRSFFARSVHEVAPDLIGVTLLVDGVGGRIVEVEAYDQEDPASHATAAHAAERVDVRAAGHAYVYRSYGIHWCLNLVCGEGRPEAALIRALEPTAGIDEQRRRRGTDDVRALCSGPGSSVRRSRSRRARRPAARPAAVRLRERKDVPEIVTRPRIGITRATELSWRYLEAGSPYVSRGRPRA